jgi:uncharacterized protein YdeI (YjbR/CyaY-like superfamily)
LFDTPACATRTWAGGLAALRRICRGAGLAEEVKWGHPCYMAHGRNIAIIGAHRGDVRLSFFDAGLLGDPAGVLERAGPNTAVPDTIRFIDNAGPEAMAPVLRAYLAEAIGHAAQGIRAAREVREPALPEELAAALAADGALAVAWAALTPGRRRSWAIAVGRARKTETRQARIAAARDRILAGQGASGR